MGSKGPGWAHGESWGRGAVVVEVRKVGHYRYGGARFKFVAEE